MLRFQLVLESASQRTMGMIMVIILQSVLTATTGTTPTPAHLTVIMDRRGSMAASSSELGRGIVAAFTAAIAAASMVVRVMVMGGPVMVMDVPVMVMDGRVMASVEAIPFEADSAAVASVAAVERASVAAVASMAAVEAASMAAAVDFTVAVAAMVVADTGKT